MLSEGTLNTDPIIHNVAAISVGIYQNTPVLDLDYAEDCTAETDMNIVMNDQQAFIEIQGTAEQEAFSQDELTNLLTLGSKGIQEIVQQQKACLQN